MTRFSYVARDSSGKPVSGTLTAPTAAAVSRQLRQEGKFLIRLEKGQAGARDVARPEPAGPPAATRAAGGAIKPRDVIFLTTQLAVMTETGVPLADALDAVTSQTNNARLRSVGTDVAERVKSGEEFSSALARHPRVFSPMYVAMVRAAEASGMMGVMLDRVAGYLTDEYETRKRIKAAVTYPCVMLAFAITVTVFLMAFVLPRFTTIYANRRAALPMPTRIAMGLSGLIVNHWPWLVGGAVASIVLIAALMRSEAGKTWWAAAKLKLPLLGGMFHKLYITQCLRTLGTLIGTGVSILESVQITRQVAGRGPFGLLWGQIDEALRAGQQLSEPMFRSRLIPHSISQMMVAGERSGKLPDVMERVASFCDRDLKGQIKTSTAMIEPVMIVVMGLIIGFVVMALLLPIFSISKVITHGGG